MIDLQYYPEIREEHDIMSVPALIVNGTNITFGKKNLEELINYLEGI